jgi:hypothetical protein
MRFSLIADDRAAYLDGACKEIDVSDLSPSVHAVQWYGDRVWGEIEYKEDKDGNRRPNERFTDVALIQVYIDRYNAA